MESKSKPIKIRAVNFKVVFYFINQQKLLVTKFCIVYGIILLHKNTKYIALIALLYVWLKPMRQGDFGTHVGGIEDFGSSIARRMLLEEIRSTKTNTA